MSDQQIPNLNTLRRGGLRGRERGHDNHDRKTGLGATSRRPISHDQIVQNTDNDAATSRLSAVDAGYLEDPFAKLLTQGVNVTRRLPLMNRGRQRYVPLVVSFGVDCDQGPMFVRPASTE